MEEDIHIQTEQKHNIAFSNVDGIVSLSIDNKKPLYSTMLMGRLPDVRPFDTSRVRFGGTHVNATFENIAIFHDIYYTNLSAGTWGTTQPMATLWREGLLHDG